MKRVSFRIKCGRETQALTCDNPTTGKEIHALVADCLRTSPDLKIICNGSMVPIADTSFSILPGTTMLVFPVQKIGRNWGKELAFCAFSKGTSFVGFVQLLVSVARTVVDFVATAFSE